MCGFSLNVKLLSSQLAKTDARRPKAPLSEDTLHTILIGWCRSDRSDLLFYLSIPMYFKDNTRKLGVSFPPNNINILRCDRWCHLPKLLTSLYTVLRTTYKLQHTAQRLITMPRALKNKAYSVRSSLVSKAYYSKRTQTMETYREADKPKRRRYRPNAAQKERERQRVFREAFATLREHLPLQSSKKIPKRDILRMAAQYIKYLADLLQQPSIRFLMDGAI